jgi:hypothetical protein
LGCGQTAGSGPTLSCGVQQSLQGSRATAREEETVHVSKHWAPAVCQASLDSRCPDGGRSSCPRVGLTLTIRGAAGRGAQGDCPGPGGQEGFSACSGRILKEKPSFPTGGEAQPKQRQEGRTAWCGSPGTQEMSPDLSRAGSQGPAVCKVRNILLSIACMHVEPTNCQNGPRTFFFFFFCSTGV